MARKGFNKNQPRDSRGRWSGGGGGGGGGGGRGGKPVGTFMQRQKAKLEQSKRDKTFKGKTTLGRDAKAAYKKNAKAAKFAAEQGARAQQFKSKAPASAAKAAYKASAGKTRAGYKKNPSSRPRFQSGDTARQIRLLDLQNAQRNRNWEKAAAASAPKRPKSVASRVTGALKRTAKKAKSLVRGR